MGKIDEERVSLTHDQQVARGQELMSLLDGHRADASPPKSSPVAEKHDWNVIVKHSFIEVVIPSPCTASRRRAMSEPAIDVPAMFDDACKSKESKLRDISDASTNSTASDAEGAAEDFSARDMGFSSEDEDEKDGMPVSSQQAAPMPYQYMEPWWMPMNFAPMSPAMGTGFDESSMGYDASAFVNAAWGQQWMDPSMAASQCSPMDSPDGSTEWRTTVMIRNMPNNYTRDMLLDLVDAMGFVGKYDFAYLPVDFQSQAGLGYAFINFSTVDDAKACFEQFEGFSNWKLPSEKVCTVTWSSPTQGFEAHIDRYRNSPVMHPSLPDEWKPVLLQNGVRVPFPLPTKAIKTPKVRQHPSKVGIA